jgi:ArsR family transcriptional regulator, arsenate/arsenite/antimonite-responsive transcriptional repressor
MGFDLDTPFCVPPGTRAVAAVASVPLFYRIRIMEEKTAVAALAALSQPVRLRVFRALVGAGRTGMNPGTLAAVLDTAASTLSFHLKELTHADLVSQEREGRNLIYRANFDRMNELLRFLTDHCCQGEPCGVSAPDCQPRRRRTTRSQA